MEQPVPAIILCGGRGTRISEVNSLLPKPLLPIGDRPVLWHIMKVLGHHGLNDFVLTLGWLGDEIRRYFLDYRALTTDFTIGIGDDGGIEYHDPSPEAPWRVTCLDTGRDSLTATRVRSAVAATPGDGPVLVTYGDGIGDIDVTRLLAFHRDHGRLATVTAVRPPGRFGELVIEGDEVRSFDEKPQTSEGAINGGFMVFERSAIDEHFPADRDVMLEREPLTSLASAGELMAYHHEGFWQPMDTPRELALLDELWRGDAPWKVWR